MYISFDMNKLNELEVFFRERQEIETSIADFRDIEQLYLGQIEHIDKETTKLNDDLFIYDAVINISKSLNSSFPSNLINSYFLGALNTIKAAHAPKLGELFEEIMQNQQFLNHDGMNYNKRLMESVATQKDNAFNRPFYIFADYFSKMDYTTRKYKSTYDLAVALKTISSKFDTAFGLPSFSTNTKLHTKADTFYKIESNITVYLECLNHIISHANVMRKKFEPLISNLSNSIVNLSENYEEIQNKLNLARSQIGIKEALLFTQPRPTGVLTLDGIEVPVKALLALPTEKALAFINEVANNNLSNESINFIFEAERRSKEQEIDSNTSSIREVIPIKQSQNRKKHDTIEADASITEKLNEVREEPVQILRSKCYEVAKLFKKISKQEQIDFGAAIDNVPGSNRDKLIGTDKVWRSYNGDYDECRVFYAQTGLNEYVILDVGYKKNYINMSTHDNMALQRRYDRYIKNIKI